MSSGYTRAELYSLERVEEIFSSGARRVGIQFPPGLYPIASRLAFMLRERGIEAVFVGTCYGPCDLADREAIRAGCDLLVHIGHSDMGLPSKLPVLYLEARCTIDPLPSVLDALPSLNFRKLGLVTTVQHVHTLERIRTELSSRGYEVKIGEGGRRARYPGQVLGCDMGSALSVADSVEAFIFVGTGVFHPLGVSAVTGREVVSVSPFGGHCSVRADDFLRWRRGRILSASVGRDFGILMSTKTGQWDEEKALHVKKMLEENGRRCVIIAKNEIRIEELEDYGLDAFVCTACPRIALDDSRESRIPVLTPFETEVMLGKRELVPYRIW